MGWGGGPISLRRPQCGRMRGHTGRGRRDNAPWLPRSGSPLLAWAFCQGPSQPRVTCVFWLGNAQWQWLRNFAVAHHSPLSWCAPPGGFRMRQRLAISVRPCGLIRFEVAGRLPVEGSFSFRAFDFFFCRHPDRRAAAASAAATGLVTVAVSLRAFSALLRCCRSAQSSALTRGECGLSPATCARRSALSLLASETSDLRVYDSAVFRVAASLM